MRITRTTFLACLSSIALSGCQPTSTPEQSIAVADTGDEEASSWEGVYEYVGPIKGQSVLERGRYMILYGPADGTAMEIGHAGVYEVAGDTFKHTVVYSTDPQQVGSVFMWTPESTSGDTLSYIIMDEAGQVTGQGRSVKRN